VQWDGVCECQLAVLNCRAFPRQLHSALARAASAYAETVNNGLEPWIGADCIVLGIDVDEEQPVVVVLLGFFEPVERESAITRQYCEFSDVVRSPRSRFGLIDNFLKSTVDLGRTPVCHRVQEIILMVFRVSGSPLIPAVLYKISGGQHVVTEMIAGVAFQNAF
jgi:hypothetical protein